MDTTIKQTNSNEYYVGIELKRAYDFNYYEVSVSLIYDNLRISYPINSRVYGMNERRNAFATYNRYVRKYIKGV